MECPVSTLPLHNLSVPLGTEVHAQDPSMDQPRDRHSKRQQRKACDVCRSRKVKCDIELCPGGPCSSCKKSGTDCRSTTQWAKPRRRGGIGRRGHSSGFHNRDVTVYQESPVTENTSGVAGAHELPSHADSLNVVHSPADATASLSPTELRSSMNCGNKSQQGAQCQEQGREQLARTGLATFFNRGINAEAWAIFSPPESFRVAYIGTPISNLAHLVLLYKLCRGRPLFSLAETPPFAQPDGTESDTGTARTIESNVHLSLNNVNDPVQALHYPYPPIREIRPWRPNSEDWGFGSARDLAADVSCFPTPDVCEALIDAYFLYVHPFTPVVSKAAFMKAYRNPNKPPPLLLLQAVLMAGTHACSHPLVAGSRHAVKSMLFRRASMLYHVRHETNRVHLMQAAMLFTWHVGDGDSITGGPWYWSGIAARIGCGLGTHRRSATLPDAETSQYRRCWWSAFILEVFSSLETGRPCAIRAEDVDQSLLRKEDMIDRFDEHEESEHMTSIDGLGSEGSDDSPDFLNNMIELAYIGLDIMAANTPSRETPVDISRINSKLGLWSIASGTASEGSGDDISTNHLRLHYNLLLLHLHRNYTDDPSSKSVCSNAARNVLGTLEKLDRMGSLASCHFTAVSAVTASGIQIVNEIREASIARTFLVVIHALEDLSRLLKCIAKLAVYWPNAEAVHDVLKGLYQEYEMQMQQNLRGEQVAVPESQLAWSQLFAGARAPQVNPVLNGQEWLNIPNWWELMQ